jgi:type VI secretion system protein ImpH
MSQAGDPHRDDPMLAIAAAPHRWDFFQALRAVDAHHPGLPRLGSARRPADEALRLGQAPDLAFAPGALAAVGGGYTPGVPTLSVHFFGLFGPNGPLPLHLTAYARERLLHKGDATMVHFADMFHHRLLLLFYRAWAQAQPAASHDRPDEDRFADFVGSLIGIGGPEWRGRDAVPAQAKLGFAGLLSRQARTADGLQSLLSGYLRVPVRVEPFVGRWMRLLPNDRSRIGRRRATRRASTAQLGVSAVLGGAVFDRQHHFRLYIGPVDAVTFESLLPSGSALPALQALVAHYMGQELGWDLQIELRPADRPECRLGRQSRLGWTTWVGASRPGERPSIILNAQDLSPPT